MFLGLKVFENSLVFLFIMNLVERLNDTINYDMSHDKL